jgi:hypothetical protein
LSKFGEEIADALIWWLPIGPTWLGFCHILMFSGGASIAAAPRNAYNTNQLASGVTNPAMRMMAAREGSAQSAAGKIPAPGVSTLFGSNRFLAAAKRCQVPGP